MKYFLLVLFNILNFTNLHSQSTNKNIQIKIKSNNGVEVFNILKENKEIIFDVKKNYYWYTEFSKIKSTKGGTGGNLLNGSYNFYDLKGNLIIIENYSYGLKHGESKIWNSNGELMEIFKYDKGDLIYWKFHPKDDEGWIEHIGEILKPGWIKNTYDKFDNLVRSENFFIDINDKIKKEKIKTTVYYQNSKQKEKEFTTFLLADDLLIGDYKIFHENGKVQVSGKLFDPYEVGINKYVGNLKDGEWKWYDNNGNLEYTEKYKVQVVYWDNGNIKFIYSLFFDDSKNVWLKHGRFYRYDSDGFPSSDVLIYKWGVLEDED